MRCMQGGWYARVGQIAGAAAPEEGEAFAEQDAAGAEEAEWDYEEQLAAQEEWEAEQQELATRMQGCSVY